MLRLAKTAATGLSGGTIRHLIRAGLAGATRDDGRRSLVQNEAVAEGILTLRSSTTGTAPSRLATASSSSSPSGPVMVLLQGSPVATKGKARSSTPASAHQPENMAGKWRNDSAASELKLEDDGEKKRRRGAPRVLL
jgi:hypothetical protein